MALPKDLAQRLIALDPAAKQEAILLLQHGLSDPERRAINEAALAELDRIRVVMGKDKLPVSVAELVRMVRDDA